MTESPDAGVFDHFSKSFHTAQVMDLPPCTCKPFRWCYTHRKCTCGTDTWCWAHQALPDPDGNKENVPPDGHSQDSAVFKPRCTCKQLRWCYLHRKCTCAETAWCWTHRALPAEAQSAADAQPDPQPCLDDSQEDISLAYVLFLYIFYRTFCRDQNTSGDFRLAEVLVSHGIDSRYASIFFI